MAQRQKTLREIFADNIRHLRERRGLTQAQLAKASGVSSRYISMLENKDKNVTIDVIEGIAKGLSCGALELFSEGAKPVPSPAKGVRDAIKLLQEVEKLI